MKRILLLLYTFTLCSAAEQTLLFVDDHEILYRPATKRVLHQPVRHESNPLLVGPSLKHQVAYCSVYHDPTSGRYQMWYQMTGAGCVVCYAESKDGISWTKPDLDILIFKGMELPFADEDGYVETPQKNGTLRRSWRSPLCIVFYDPRHEAFVAYGKMWTPWPDGTLAWKHAMGRMESKDFIHWSKPELITTVNDRDAPQLEFHTSPVFTYNGMYFSLNHFLGRSVGSMDAEFMCSRDGFRWDRSLQGSFAIPRGQPGRFDAESIITNGTPVILEKEMRFYYGGYRGTAIGGVGLNEQKLGGKDYHSGVGLVTTPRDRFAAIGINPDSPVKAQKKDKPKLVNTIGNITLKAIDLTGVKIITVNADASKGSVRLEVLNEDGYRLRGFTKEDAVPQVSDDLSHVATWKEKKLPGLLPGKYILRVHLDKADLFALTLRP